MKRIINRRSLAAIVLASLVPLSIQTGLVATGQPGFVATGQEGRPQDPAIGTARMPGHKNSDPQSQADVEHAAQTRKLLSDYNDTEDEKERGQILDELTKVVAAHFEIRQQFRERELKQLEEQVKKLRELQQQRAKEKDQIVRDRVRQLIRDVDGLGWGNQELGDVTAGEKGKKK